MDGLADGEGSGGGGVGSGGGGGGGAGGGGGGATFRRNRGVNWTEEETEQLLEAWSDRDVQLLLENGPHNRQAFERVSFHLASRGMDKTPSQCREKIKKLKTVYRNLGAQGDGARVSRKIRGRLVQKLHQVMGGLPVAQPMTSVAPREPEKTIEDRSDDFGAGFHHGTQDFFATTSVGDGSSSDAEGGGSAEAARSASLREASSGGGVGGVGGGSSSSNGRRRHRRRSSGSPSASTRALHVLVDKIVAAQAGCTERLAALEERRMLLDKELEEKRLEAEGRRQEAQRQHELRLLSTMAQQMANVLKSLNPLTFAGARGCENGAGVGVPQGVADAAKAHDGVVAVVGVADQCGVVDNYGHPEGAVYSTM